MPAQDPKPIKAPAPTKERPIPIRFSDWASI